jgi:large subunit ribosomal protein L24
MKTLISAQPRKQRKFRRNAPLHKKQKMLASPLSKELREKYKRRSMPVRKKDIVQVVRGEYKNVKGEVLRVNSDKYKIYVDGVKEVKADATNVEGAVDPSNVIITDLYLDDKKRRKIIERKLSAGEKMPEK